MIRIAILVHSSHKLFVEDVDEKVLEKYNGDEQAYIDDNYTFDDGNYSWDYITDASYIGPVNGDPYDLNEKIDELKKEDIY